jgi:hypothetical protein
MKINWLCRNPHRNKQSLLGAPAFHAFAPAARASPLLRLLQIRLKYILKKEGVMGMLPLGCFPLRGRERVILKAAAENERIETKEDFYRADYFFF